jgi:hypothetical protein
MLFWVGRAPSPCLFLLGIVGLCLKDVMLAIDIASTYGFLCCTLDQCLLVKSATRSIGLQGLIFDLLILQGISCLYYKTYLYDTFDDCDTTLVTLGSVLTYFSMEKRSLFFVKGGPSHPCGWG